MPNRRTVREGERFKCPYPGCKRSFAELWRLKVHYRAPPDVRGSGKERGHGQELAQCPQCGARLLPGKHHIQCSGARPKRGEAEKNGKVAPSGAAAATAKKYHIPGVPASANGLSAEQFAGLPHTSIRPGVHLQRSQWAGAHVGQSQADPGAQLYAYTPYSQEGPAEASWPPQGYILAPHPQQHAQPPKHAQQHLAQPHQPRPAMYGQSHEHVQAVPQVLQHMRQHASPVQYTNTFVRESVPGNPSAAHCSLQTDLCGAVWPLNQPFPIISSSMMPQSHPAYTVLHSAQGWAGSGVPMHADHSGAVQLQNAAMQGHNITNASATLADSNFVSQSKASQLSTMSQSTMAALQMHGGMMPTPENDAGASMGVLATAVATSSNQNQPQPPAAENAAAMNQQSQQQQQQSHQQQDQQGPHPSPLPVVDHGAGVYQPTVKMEITGQGPGGPGLHSSMQDFQKAPSPPASPPPVLVDLPFDFGKFDELEHAHVYGGAHSGQSTAADRSLNDMDSIFDVPAITDSEDLFKIFTHDSQGNPMITSHIHQRHEDPHELEFISNVFQHSTVNTEEFEGEGIGASVGDCRMAETDPAFGGAYASTLGVTGPS